MSEGSKISIKFQYIKLKWLPVTNKTLRQKETPFYNISRKYTFDIFIKTAWNLSVYPDSLLHCSIFSMQYFFCGILRGISPCKLLWIQSYMLALAKLILFLIWILYFEQFYGLKLSFILLICFTLVYIKFSSNINLFNWPPQQQTPKFDNSRIYLRIKTITDLQAYFFWQANSIYFFTEYLSPSIEMCKFQSKNSN